MSTTATRSTTALDAIVIRRAGDADAEALRRLARLDAGVVPSGELLVVEADGELRAALSIADRTYIADPFHPTAELVALHEHQAARLRHETMGTGARMRSRVSLWSHLWWRAAQVRPSH